MCQVIVIQKRNMKVEKYSELKFRDIYLDLQRQITNVENEIQATHII